MNTDNFSILGQTIDFGPFQFLDAFDYGYICNHSDEQGRYAFDQQPKIAMWTLSQFATAIFSFLKKEATEDEIVKEIIGFKQKYEHYYRVEMGKVQLVIR